MSNINDEPMKKKGKQTQNVMKGTLVICNLFVGFKYLPGCELVYIVIFHSFF